MTEANSVARKGERGGTGNFFIVDRRLWKAVCDLGDINASAAWLLLMQGTGGNHRTTAWSVDSIKRYLGIGFPRAKAAIEKLLASRFIRHGEKHTPLKPRYDLFSFAEWNAIKAEAQKDQSAGSDENADYNLIWLPNELVTGTPNGEKSPINKLRASGDPWALRLFIDLYHEHNLRDDGGITRKYLWQEYEAIILGKRGPYRIMGFKPSWRRHSWEGPFQLHESRPRPKPESKSAWDSLKVLEQTGLLSFVPHLVENDTSVAETIHAVGIGGRSEHPIETAIGNAVRQAVAVMGRPWQLEKARDEGLILCSVSHDYPNAQMVGIARLHYRPHTKRTSAWSSNLRDDGTDYVEKYRRLAAEYATTMDEIPF